MFDNIGEKIKALATIECICGIIGSVLLGIVIMTEELLLGLVVAIVGSLASWLGSFVIYGFGDLVETNRRILSKLSSDEKESSFVPTPKILLSMQESEQEVKEIAQTTMVHRWRCDGCGNMISEEVCPFCEKTTGDAAEK